VIECGSASVVLVVLSQQPQNLPGVSHFVGFTVVVDVAVKSSVVVLKGVFLGTLGDVDGSEVVAAVVVSLHPNQPGVLQVEVVVVVVVVVVKVVDVVEVVSSRQPHQPGVLQVSVLVRVMVDVEVFEVVVSVPLLSYIFQLAQSRHSGVKTHSGTLSYFMMMSWITVLILCVPMPTRQPLSATTSYTHSRPAWQAVSRAYPPKEHDAVAPLHVPM
jgi:hypothetical protein